ncbi:thioredoxin family protein [Hydrogenophaga sp.]|uniref:thioredoxin family protein n=1 Tax=Hydrogenophaga sp. TaxID=1904254 RepID=UPI003AF7C368
MPSSSESQLLVVCLCADWCGTCRDYRPVPQSLVDALPGVRALWVDIEDHAEVLGDTDVQDFPTVLLVHDGALLFYGPLLPHRATLERLVQQALTGRLSPLEPDSEMQALIGRVMAFAQATG